MKRYRTIFLTCLAIIVGVFTTACANLGAKDEEQNEASIKKLEVNELNASDIQILDTRDESQYIGWETEEGPGGHIKNAIDFPESWIDIESNKTKLSTELKRREIDTSRKTVIYSNGDTKEETYNKFVKLGFKDLYVLNGGMTAYKKANLPIEKMENYQVLVSPKWVYDLAENKKPDTFKGGDYKIVEIDFGKDKGDYEKGHIPGAISIDDSLNHVEGERILVNYKNISEEDKFRFWNRPSNDVIRQKLQDMGITKDTTVILYGNNTTAAARCGVVMKYAGVEDVRLLNGGKKLLKYENMPLEKGKVENKSVKSFGVDIPQNPGVLIDYDEELKLVNDTENAVIASVRSFVEYKGEKSGYTYIKDAGEIKNARFAYAGSDPYNMEDYRNIDDTMFNYELINKRWQKWGITPDKKISFHCGTGWRASETYFYALAMGWEDICVYDGGWYEWHLKEDSPKKEKGLPDDAPETEANSFF